MFQNTITIAVVEAAVAGETEVAMGVDKEVMVAAMAAKEITVIINRVAIVEEVTAGNNS